MEEHQSNDESAIRTAPIIFPSGLRVGKPSGAEGFVLLEATEKLNGRQTIIAALAIPNDVAKALAQAILKTTGG